jgi:RNase P/RNase MRP subunit POP5
MAVRDKHRYILVETSVSTALRTNKQLEYKLYSAMMGVLGSMNYHKVNPKIVRFSGDSAFALKVRHEGADSAMAALALIRSLDGKTMGFYTTKSSGTLQALFKK